MNVVVLMGRLTRDPEVRYTQGENPMAIGRYTLAVDRRFKQGDQTADFVPCVVFGKGAEFAEKYFHQGSRVSVSGRIQTGSYTNKDGQKVYTTEVVLDNQEFAESKAESAESRAQANFPVKDKKRKDPREERYLPDADGFVTVPEGIDEELPFN